jgi:hypothetical protein
MNLKDLEPIYISGQMTGIKNYNFPAFYEAEDYLKSIGFEVIINPATISKNMIQEKNCNYDDIHYLEYLKEDFRQLLECKSLFLLKGWKNSNGALKEKKLAEWLKYNIYYQDNTKDLENIN